MSLARELHIHSDVNNNDEFEMDFEVKAKGPVYIGQDNAKRFLIAVSVTFFFFVLPMLASVALIIIPGASGTRKKNYLGRYFVNLFGNNNRKFTSDNGYSIAAIVVLFLSLTLIAVLPIFGRKRMKYLMLPLIFLSMSFLSFFMMQLQTMQFEFLSGRLYICIWAYLLFINASLGALVSVIACNRVPRTKVGFAVALPLMIGEFVLMYYKNFSTPIAWVYLGVFFGQGFLVAYCISNLRFMVMNRYDYYFRDDWFLGFVHLLTDWSFRYWKDLIFPRPLVDYRAFKERMRKENELALEVTSQPQNQGEMVAQNPATSQYHPSQEYAKQMSNGVSPTVATTMASIIHSDDEADF